MGVSNMDEAVRAVLAEYEERRQREFELFAQIGFQEVRVRHDEFLMSIGTEAGLLLNILIKEAKALRILELGTSYGHSTIYLAEAARAVGGTVVSCDLSPEKQAYAKAMLERAGLVDYVDLRPGDARQVVTARTEEIDFVLLDMQISQYIEMFELVYPRLASGAFIAADNIRLPVTSEADAYRRHLRTKPEIESILLPVGQGIELSRRAD
jgi:predicted O-methyltransferase YrrM